jgi:tetratricopeptide (TPR) repeat protein
MSYINDALRKAQRERDGRYGRFGGIIASGPERPEQPRRRRLAVGVAVMLLVLVPAGLILFVYVMQQPSPAKKDSSRPVVAGNSAAFQPLTPQAARNAVPEAVPAGATPGGSQVEKTASPGEGAPATVQKGAKPVLREAEARYKEALIAQRKGDLRKAKELYRKVLTLDPEHVKALNNLGVIYMGQKMRGKAIAAFGRAVVLKKDYVDPYYNLACLYAQTNEIDESLWYLKVAVTINGDVKNWAGKDADLKNIAASPAFKKMMEGREN